MRTLIRFASLPLIVGILLVVACKDDETPIAEFEEIVVTANRASGNITFINAEDNSVLKTLDIASSEPMYAVYVAATDKLYLGDRAQDRVYVI